MVDGNAWCNEEFHLVQSRRVERFCLLGLSSRLNTRLLREEVESHGLSVKSVVVQQQTDKERDDWTRRELYYHNRYEGLASEID